MRFFAVSAAETPKGLQILSFLLQQSRIAVSMAPLLAVEGKIYLSVALSKAGCLKATVGFL